MPLDRAERIIRQVGQALSAAHDQGVLHRDLKPENIMLVSSDSEEHVRLIDFGIASVLDSDERYRTTAIAGTVHYMAPEQLKGRPETASDIYAMGVIAYELITGRRPFDPPSPYQLLDMQRAGVSERPSEFRPDLSPEADRVILRALAFLPKDRYQSAREFGNELANALRGRPGDETAKSSESPKSGVQIAQVLYIEEVGYSSLTIEEQARRLELLHCAVRGSQEFQRALASGNLAALPTSGGMALIFFLGDPVAAARCAVEIARAIIRERQLDVRMGIDMGPVQIINDINNKPSARGGGIDNARQIMEIGDVGHILITRSMAAVLSQLTDWTTAIEALGEIDGLDVFNLRAAGTGNLAHPSRMQIISEHPKKKRRPAVILLASVILFALIGLSLWLYFSRKEEKPLERKLTYFLEMKKSLKTHPASQPSVVRDDTIFEVGDHLRLNVSSSEDGFLYVINERPNPSGGSPRFTLIFPVADGGSALIRAGQTVQIPEHGQDQDLNWLVFDDEEGTEKIWLVCSKDEIAELESVKHLANPRDRGEIKNIDRIRDIEKLLSAQSEPRVEKNEAMAALSSTGEIITQALKLEHRRVKGAKR
jgi:hypothetical protein